MINKIIYIVLVTNIFVGNLSAQIKSTNNDVWFHYVGKYMLATKLSFTLEGTMRYANGLDQKQQYFIRPSIDYQFTKHFLGSVGYTHYKTFVYGSPAINKIPIPEDHAWIQGTFVHQFGGFKITNRIRDENRFVSIATKPLNATDYQLTDTKYRNRLRYMLLATYPILKKNKKTTLFGIIGDEAFFNIGKHAGKTLMNQNRIIAGLGYQFNPVSQIQLCYIHQNIWNFSNTIFENNPTVRISYISNVSLKKKKS